MKWMIHYSRNECDPIHIVQFQYSNTMINQMLPSSQYFLCTDELKKKNQKYVEKYIDNKNTLQVMARYHIISQWVFHRVEWLYNHTIIFIVETSMIRRIEESKTHQMNLEIGCMWSSRIREMKTEEKSP